MLSSYLKQVLIVSSFLQLALQSFKEATWHPEYIFLDAARLHTAFATLDIH